jgi:TctA family transporter
MIALLLAAMIMQGVVPGPQFMVEQPDVFWTLVASFIIGNILLVLLNLPLIGIWIRVLKIPYQWLYPVLLVFVAFGAYSLRNSTFDILMVAVFGIFGVILRRYGFQPLPVLLGFVLGPLLEENFRRSLIMSQGDFSIFVATSIATVCLAISAGLILYRLTNELVNKNRVHGVDEI